MRCLNCGFENKDEVNFCANCGQKIKKQVKRKSNIIFLISIIFLLVVVGASAYSYISGNVKDKSKVTQIEVKEPVKSTKFIDLSNLEKDEVNFAFSTIELGDEHMI